MGSKAFKVVYRSRASFGAFLVSGTRRLVSSSSRKRKIGRLIVPKGDCIHAFAYGEFADFIKLADRYREKNNRDESFYKIGNVDVLHRVSFSVIDEWALSRESQEYGMKELQLPFVEGVEEVRAFLFHGQNRDFFPGEECPKVVHCVPVGEDELLDPLRRHGHPTVFIMDDRRSRDGYEFSRLPG